MANNLIKKGHQLVVFDLVRPAVDAAVAAGATKADSPSQVGESGWVLQDCITGYVVQVASQADTVITMLPAKTHVYQCYDGPDGVLKYVHDS